MNSSLFAKRELLLHWIGKWTCIPKGGDMCLEVLPVHGLRVVGDKNRHSGTVLSLHLRTGCVHFEHRCWLLFTSGFPLPHSLLALAGRTACYGRESQAPEQQERRACRGDHPDGHRHLLIAMNINSARELFDLWKLNLSMGENRSLVRAPCWQKSRLCQIFHL